MSGEEKKRVLEERLDRLGRTVVRAYASNDEEAEAAASAPFAYARLRARIQAEAARREEGDGWLAVLGVVWRAVPAMALVAVLSFALFLSAGAPQAPQQGFSDEALLDGSNGAGTEQVVFTDARSISNDDVLATIISDEGREDSR
jgi:cytochrome c-type biogenesis protein CcmH/NrfG